MESILGSGGLLSSERGVDSDFKNRHTMSATTPTSIATPTTTSEIEKGNKRARDEDNTSEHEGPQNQKACKRCELQAIYDTMDKRFDRDYGIPLIRTIYHRINPDDDDIITNFEQYKSYMIDNDPGENAEFLDFMEEMLDLIIDQHKFINKLMENMDETTKSESSWKPTHDRIEKRFDVDYGLKTLRKLAREINKYATIEDEQVAEYKEHLEHMRENDPGEAQPALDIMEELVQQLGDQHDFIRTLMNK